MSDSLTIKDALTTDSQKKRGILQKFFEGKFYPFLVAAIVLTGHITGYEAYLCCSLLILASISLLVCDSIKPFLPFLLTFVYQINKKHTPGHPTWSNYYLQYEVLIPVLICFLFFVVCIVKYFKNHVYPKLSIKKSPLMISIILLSLAFILNGAFSSKWNLASLLYGSAQVLVYFFLFYLIFYGLEKENKDELINHITYLTALVALVLIGEMIFLFSTYENLITQWGGHLNHGEVLLGWGVSTPIGFSFSILIPVLMRGTIKSKFSIVYFLIATFCLIFAFLTLSRNAMFFSTLAFGISLVIILITSKKRFLLAFLAIILTACFWYIFANYSEKLRDIFYFSFEYFGFSSNSRKRLWDRSIQMFRENLIFGSGFFGYDEEISYTAATFLPDMAHGTIFQLLGSMGLLGIISYAIYRIRSFAPFVRKITVDKILLLGAILVTICMSLLDNYMFYFSTIFYYTTILAVAFRIREEDKKEIAAKKAEKQADKLKRKNLKTEKKICE